MRFVAWGRSSPWIVNTHSRRRSALSCIDATCRSPLRVGAGLVDGAGPRTVLDHAAAQPGEPRRAARRAQLRRVDHEVVVEVGDAAAALAARGLGEDADREGLEVVREVAADGVLQNYADAKTDVVREIIGRARATLD